MSITQYLDYLTRYKSQCPEYIKKQRRFLMKIETELNRPMLNCAKTSEIDDAILKAAGKRKMAYNGGHFDDGRGMRFRLGQAAACFTRWAHGEGLIERNPYPKNSFPRPYKREAGFCTDEQMQVLYQSDRLDILENVFIRFFTDSMMRVSEFCDLKISHINFKDGLVRVYSKKTDEFHSVPITDSTLCWTELLLSRRAVKSEYLAANAQGERISEHSVREVFRGISKKVHFRVHPHKLRHTGATLNIMHNEQGVVMRMLGHTDPATTNHYIHVTAKNLKQAQGKTYENIPWMKNV